MDKHLILTQSERQLMQFLWQKPYTLMELVEEVGKTIGWTKSTVATMVRRMEEKGILRHEEQGRRKIFYPAITQQEAAIQETDSLLQRVFQGSIGFLVSNMAQCNQLTKEDLDELYEIIRQAKEDAQ